MLGDVSLIFYRSPRQGIGTKTRLCSICDTKSLEVAHSVEESYGLCKPQDRLAQEWRRMLGRLLSPRHSAGVTMRE